MLDFFNSNGTINSLFENIQTYLKLQSPKLMEKETDYRSGCEMQNNFPSLSSSIRKSICQLNLNFIHQMDESNKIKNMVDGKSFNPEILFVLYNR